MKSTLLVALLALLNVTAASAEDTLVYGYPTIAVQGSFVAIDELCFDGDLVRTQKPIQRCTVFKDDEGGECLVMESAILKAPKEQFKAKCAAFQTEGDNEVCKSALRIAFTLEKDFDVPVYKIVDDDLYEQVSVIQFKIPACK